MSSAAKQVGLDLYYVETGARLTNWQKRTAELKRRMEKRQKKGDELKQKVDELLKKIPITPADHGQLDPRSGAKQDNSGEKDAADKYFKGYVLSSAGEKLEEKSDPAGALRKYIDALKLIEGVAKEYPTWQSQIVAFRLKKLKAAILRVEPGARGRVEKPQE